MQVGKNRDFRPISRFISQTDAYTKDTSLKLSTLLRRDSNNNVKDLVGSGNNNSDDVLQNEIP